MKLNAFRVIGALICINDAYRPSAVRASQLSVGHFPRSHQEFPLAIALANKPARIGWAPRRPGSATKIV
jgi:hypothetical protein